MKYESIHDLPKIIRVALPEEAQEVYRDTYNQTWAEADQALTVERRDSIAHEAGWAAVEQVYEHDEEQGQWHRKADEEEDKGLLDKLKNFLPKVDR